MTGHDAEIRIIVNKAVTVFRTKCSNENISCLPYGDALRPEKPVIGRGLSRPGRRAYHGYRDCILYDRFDIYGHCRGESTIPRAFTETEANEIRAALCREARNCLARYGVRKTTVDQMARGAGISKGSFYRFFPSKEALLFHAVEEYQKELFQSLFQMVKERKLSGRNGLAEAIWYLFDRVKESFMVNLMRPEEMSLLLRGLPRETVSSHHQLDDNAAMLLLEALHLPETSVKAPLFSTALRALALALMHREEAGMEHFDEALKLLVRGLVLAGVKEKN